MANMQAALWPVFYLASLSKVRALEDKWGAYVCISLHGKSVSKLLIAKKVDHFDFLTYYVKRTSAEEYWVKQNSSLFKWSYSLEAKAVYFTIFLKSKYQKQQDLCSK